MIASVVVSACIFGKMSPSLNPSITQEFYSESSLSFVINGHVEFLKMRRNRIFFSQADFGGLLVTEETLQMYCHFPSIESVKPPPAPPPPPRGQKCENSGKI